MRKVLLASASAGGGGREGPAAAPSSKLDRVKEAEMEALKEDLETYLRVVVASCDQWQPRNVHTVKIPHPEDRRKAKVPVNICVFEFFEMEEFLATVTNNADDVLRAETSINSGSPPVSARLNQSHDLSAEATPTSSTRHMATLLPTIPDESARSVGFEELALATAAQDITAKIRAKVENFTIYRGDHIDYHIHVDVCGHHWVVSKRYSELEDLHETLKSTYGKEQVPSFSESRVASWRKRDPKTGILRQKFFAAYLKEVIANISQWDPPAIFMTFELNRCSADGLRSTVNVTLNQFLFEFFSFKDHILQLSGDDALQAIEGNQSTLSHATVRAFQMMKRNDKQDALRHAVEQQAANLQPTTDGEVRDLLYAFSLLRDDKDIIRLFEHFLVTGEIVQDIKLLDVADSPRLVTVAGGGSETMRTPETTPRTEAGYQYSGSGPTSTPMRHSRRFLLDKDICDEAIQKGVTSAQLLQFIEPILFNDTRIAVIRLFTPALIDMSDLQLVFDALWFDWESARKEVVDLLLAKRGHNSNQYE